MVIYDVYYDNNIGNSGCISMGEVLKVNSTLTELNLDWGVDNVWLRISWWLFKFRGIIDFYNGNNIRYSGGKVIGEVLKFNSTLAKLSLAVRS